MINLAGSLASIPNGTEKLASAFGFVDLGVYGQKVCETVDSVLFEAESLFPDSKLYSSFGDNIWSEYPSILPNHIKKSERLISWVPLLYSKDAVTLFVLNAKFNWEEPAHKNPEVHCYVRDKKLLDIAEKHCLKFAKSGRIKATGEFFMTSLHIYLGFSHPKASINKVGTPFISHVLKN